MSEQNRPVDPVEMLENITQTGAPPFLLTRIRQKIADARQTVPGKWVAATAVSIACIFIFNVYLVSGKFNASADDSGMQLATAMNLIPGNALYE